MARLRYLQTNGKLENSSTFTYAFNLPAITTCPGAGICKEYCFALSEQKRYPSAMAYRERSLALSKGPEFVDVINAEIATLRHFHKKSGTTFAIRIHASGDFYSVKYIASWCRVVADNPDIQFYAYTKSVFHWQWAAREWRILPPSNLTLIYSLGGRYDTLVDPECHRHARIFTSEQAALDAGYTLANEDDTVAWTALTNKIGLVAFGATAKFRKVSGEG